MCRDHGGAADGDSRSTFPGVRRPYLKAAVGTLELFGIYVGDRLGLYDLLRDGRGRTPQQLAAEAGIHPRYAREWLEQQAVAAILEVEDPEVAADARSYSLPRAHADVLAEPTHELYLAPLSRLAVGIANALDDVVDAYRTGAGVPYTRYGADFRHGQGAINRPIFTAELPTTWLSALDGVADRLRAGGRAVDVGCGHGWAAIALAKAFPEASVLGIDSDHASVDEARAHAAAAGAPARFEQADAGDLAAHGLFDLVTVLEVLHDLARPVEVLAAAREALAEDGVVLVADEAVAETFTAPGDELERMMYGWSITHCLPTALAEQPSAAIGTAIRPQTVLELAAAAGFGRVRVLDVDAGFFRLYELRP